MARRALLIVAAILFASACNAPACPGVGRDEGCRAACEAGDAVACARVGVAFEMEGDVAAARRYFERACDSASEEQRALCLLRLSAGDEMAADARVEALARLCDEGVALACHERVRAITVATAIELPEPESGPARTVSIAADGALQVDGEPTTFEALQSLEAGRAVIAADQRVPHARVIEVIDALRAAGVTRYSIAVQPR